MLQVFYTTLFFCFPTFQREILYFFLHYIYFLSCLTFLWKITNQHTHTHTYTNKSHLLAQQMIFERCVIVQLTSIRTLSCLVFRLFPINPYFLLFSSLPPPLSWISPLSLPPSIFPSGLDPKCPPLTPPTHFSFLLSLSSFFFRSLSRLSPSHLTPISVCPGGSRISPVMEKGCGSVALFQLFFSAKSLTSLCVCVGDDVD